MPVKTKSKSFIFNLQHIEHFGTGGGGGLWGKAQEFASNREKPAVIDIKNKTNKKPALAFAR